MPNRRGSIVRMPGIALALIGAAVSGSAAFAQARSDVDPYWVSLRDDQAHMRTGPRASYPIKWVYQRKNMPMKVIGKDSVWRKVEDMDGDQGWMHVQLLSRTRTAIVIGEAVEPMRDAPRGDAGVNWRAEPGVVGKISECDPSFCLFDVAGRMGYISRDAIWGDEPLAGEIEEQDEG